MFESSSPLPLPCLSSLRAVADTPPLPPLLDGRSPRGVELGDNLLLQAKQQELALGLFSGR